MATVAEAAPEVLLLLFALVVAGAGVALAGNGLFSIAESSTTGERPAGSLFVSGTDLGAAIGVAVFGAILISVATLNVVGAANDIDLIESPNVGLERVADELEDELLHLSEPDTIALAVEIDAIDPLEQAIRASVADAMRVAFLAMTAAAVIALAVSLVLWRIRGQPSGDSVAG